MSYNFQSQRIAIREAASLLSELPNVRWSLTATEADSYSDPSVLNIYVNQESRPLVVAALSPHIDMTKVLDEGDTYVSYRQGSLIISIIEGED